MKFKSLIIAACFLMVWGCGGGAQKPASAITSNIAKKVFVTNEFNGAIYIVDAATDKLSPFTINGAIQPQSMYVAGTRVIVYEKLPKYVSVIDSVKETAGFQAALGEDVENLAVNADGSKVYAALTASAKVGIVSVNGAQTPATVPSLIPSPRRVVLSNNGSKLLVFSNISNSVMVMNTSDNSAVAVAGFDRAYNAVFSADDSRAYILSCGAECGGTNARVTELILATNTLGLSSPVLNGATVGTLSNGTLYVSGNSAGGIGSVTAINPATLAVSATTSTGVSDGLHTIITPVSNGKLYIGAKTCTTGSCLTIYTTAANTAKLGALPPTGSSLKDVTGMTAIKNRDVVYVVEGRNLRIYETAGDTTPAIPQVDITGAVYDVKEVN